MSQAPLYPTSAPSTPLKPITIDDLEKVVRSTAIAWGTITGLPTLGILASLSLRVALGKGRPKVAQLPLLLQ